MREGFASFLWIALARGCLCYWQALLALSVPDSWKQFKTSFKGGGGGGGTQRFLKRPLKHVSRTSCVRFPQSKRIQGKSCSFESHMKLLLLYFCIYGDASLMFTWGYLYLHMITRLFDSSFCSALSGAFGCFTGSAGIDSKGRISLTYEVLKTIILPWKSLWFQIWAEPLSYMQHSSI